MQDEEIVKLMQLGNEVGYAELIKEYQPKLLAFTSRYVDEADAQDIVQNTFVKIYKNIKKIDPSRKLSTYIFEIAKNEAISFLRKHKREVPMDEQIEDTKQQVVPETGVTEVVEKLPDKYKKVIKFYYFDELSYHEIAKKLKLPVNTIRTHLHRAKLALRQMLLRVFGKIHK